MTIITEQSLTNFEFWSGAKDNVAELSYSQLEQVEAMLEDIYPDGCTDTTINDLFWFEFDTVKDWLGITEEEEEEVCED